jgi:hypothetical protein
MRRSFAVTALFTLVLSHSALACSDAQDNAQESARPSTTLLVSTGGIEAQTAARLRKGGTFMFELERSPRVSALMKAKCALRSAGCYDEIKREAATEGVRISTNAEGQLVYTSFGEGEVFLETPFRVVSQSGTEIRVEALGPAAKQASGVITMDLANDGTLAIVDPFKGRLSYAVAR